MNSTWAVAETSIWWWPGAAWRATRRATSTSPLSGRLWVNAAWTGKAFAVWGRFAYAVNNSCLFVWGGRDPTTQDTLLTSGGVWCGAPKP